jgi:hypothetical protein
MKVATKGYSLWFMFFLHQMLNHIHMKFLLSTKNSRMCLRREMWTPCPNIDNTIAPLILWKECNLHLDPSIICCKFIMQHLVNLNENFEKRFIWHSKFPIDAPIFLVKNKDDFFKMCLDYHGLNRLTIKH